MKHYYRDIQGWFNYKNLFTKAVKYYPDGSHFVEMGCWRGRSTVYLGVEIFNSNKNIKLDCVDTWKGSIQHTNDPEFSKILETDGIYKEFLENIKPINNIINIVRDTSVSAASNYSDNSIDFVFIDGSHDYESVLQDLHAWYPKIKINGAIAGHDYNWPSVKKAVNKFFSNKPGYRNLTDCGEKSWLFSTKEFSEFKI